MCLIVKAVQIFARRDRQPAIAHDAPVAFNVVGDSRPLEPIAGVRRQRTRSAHGLVNTPAHIGIDHQRKISAEMFAHRADPLVVLRQRRPSDLHLDRALETRTGPY